MGTARYPTLGSIHPHLFRPSGSRGTAYLATAVGVICAAAVFFVLCARDHSLALEGMVTASRPAHTELVDVPSHSTPAPTAPAQSKSSEIPFNLARSRRFQNVGPIRVGVWRIDLRRGLVDLSVLANGHRTNRNRVKVDDSIPIDTKDPNRPIKLIVKSIDKNGVSGSIILG